MAQLIQIETRELSGHRWESWGFIPGSEAALCPNQSRFKQIATLKTRLGLTFRKPCLRDSIILIVFVLAIVLQLTADISALRRWSGVSIAVVMMIVLTLFSITFYIKTVKDILQKQKPAKLPIVSSESPITGYKVIETLNDVDGEIGYKTMYGTFPLHKTARATCEHSSHHAPDPAGICRCGFNAVKKQYLGGLLNWSNRHLPRHILEVELGGYIVEYEKGYRATYIRPIALWMWPGICLKCGTNKTIYKDPKARNYCLGVCATCGSPELFNGYVPTNTSEISNILNIECHLYRPTETFF